jgi:hypothetical protein
MRDIGRKNTKTYLLDMKHSIDLTLEVRSADGTAAEFYQPDAARVGKALRFLSTPRLFAEPQLTFASEHWVTAIATRTIDVILARTNAPVPAVLPLKSPAGPIDISEVAKCVSEDDESVVLDKRDRKNSEAMNSRSFRVEVYTFGGWSNILGGARGDSRQVYDRRQTFSHIFQVPVIPFKLCTGGIGFINPGNLTRATACPAPDSLPDTALPMQFLRWNPFRSRTKGNAVRIP